MNCINCKSDLSQFEYWEYHEEIIKCHQCGKQQKIIGDDIYDEDANDDYSYFITEEIE